MEKLMAAVAFVQAHQALFAGVAIALLDLGFALSDKINGNGVLHQLYLFLKKDKPQA